MKNRDKGLKKTLEKEIKTVIEANPDKGLNPTANNFKRNMKIKWKNQTRKEKANKNEKMGGYYPIMDITG